MSRPLVLDASLLQTTDAAFSDHTVGAALAGAGLAATIGAAPALATMAGAGLGEVRAWLLGEGPPPRALAPRRPKGLLARAGKMAAAVDWSSDALVLRPGLPLAHREAARSRAGRRVLALVQAPPDPTWPEYLSEAATTVLPHRLATLAEAAAIVVPDEAARDHLAGVLPKGHRPPLHVLPPPFFLRGAVTRPDADLTGVPYFLVPDRIEARANVSLLLHLWRDLIHAGRTMPKLVLAGDWGAQVEEIRPLLDWNATLARHVAVAAGLSRAALAHLLRHARGVLAPAFSGADGPLLRDALALGAPVVAADSVATRGLPGVLRLSPIDGMGWRRAILALADGSPGPRAPAAAIPDEAAYVAGVLALARSL